MFKREGSSFHARLASELMCSFVFPLQQENIRGRKGTMKKEDTDTVLLTKEDIQRIKVHEVVHFSLFSILI